MTPERGEHGPSLHARTAASQGTRTRINLHKNNPNRACIVSHRLDEVVEASGPMLFIQEHGDAALEACNLP